jgi:hypothetical protein
MFAQNYQIRQTYYFDADRFGFGVHFEEQTTKEHKNGSVVIFSNTDHVTCRSNEAHIKATMPAILENVNRYSIKDHSDAQGNNFS